MEFAYDGGGLGKGGTATLYVDGSSVGQGRVEATQPMIFSADETTDIGADSATPVSDDYDSNSSTFPGGCAGSRSTSVRTPRTPTTSFPRRRGTGSRWLSSSHRIQQSKALLCLAPDLIGLDPRHGRVARVELVDQVGPLDHDRTRVLAAADQILW